MGQRSVWGSPMGLISVWGSPMGQCSLWGSSMGQGYGAALWGSTPYGAALPVGSTPYGAALPVGQRSLWGSSMWQPYGAALAMGQRYGAEQWGAPHSAARARVVTGAELAALPPEALEAALRAHPEMVFARTSPQQKLVIVESCQKLVRNRNRKRDATGTGNPTGTGRDP